MAELDIDALANLEDRIRRAVDLVATLRAERDAAIAELAEFKKSSGSANEQVTKPQAELDILLSERQQVRARIEKLLGQMDQLS